MAVPTTSPVQTPVPLASRKLQILGFDAAGNIATYAIPSAGLQPFPVALTPSFPIFLPGVTATTGGTATCLDGLNISGVTQVIAAVLSINDNLETWKLRPYQGGDLNASDGVSVVVPVVNPNNLRWIRIS